MDAFPKFSEEGVWSSIIEYLINTTTRFRGYKQRKGKAIFFESKHLLWRITRGD